VLPRLIPSEGPASYQLASNFSGEPDLIRANGNMEYRANFFSTESNGRVPSGYVLREDLNLVSPKKKYVVALGTAFSHMIQDELTSILYFHRKYGSSVQIIIVKPADETIVPVISGILDKLGADYLFVEFYDAFYINNYFTAIGFSASLPALREMYMSIDLYLSQFNIVPHRKIYISRTKTPIRVLGHEYIADDSLRRYDIRIDNEELVERYMRENGVEVVYPEDFSSFNEQLKYIRSAKVLITVSGAALTNLAFMQSGQTVLELANQLETNVGRDTYDVGYHTHYYEMALARQHKYITVHHNGSADIVLSTFEDEPYLKALLEVD